MLTLQTLWKGQFRPFSKNKAQFEPRRKTEAQKSHGGHTEGNGGEKKTRRPHRGTPKPDIIKGKQDNHPNQMSDTRPKIYLFTDGAASGNPGPGGYGVVLRCGSYEKELSGGYSLTTNNRMELLAVIIGLEAIKWENAEVEVWSDSSYVVKAINEGWLANWQRNGFKKKKNVDLWTRFIPLYNSHRITFHWLKGHAGHPDNERCDRLAVAAYNQPNLPPDEGYNPDE